MSDSNFTDMFDDYVCACECGPCMFPYPCPTSSRHCDDCQQEHRRWLRVVMEHKTRLGENVSSEAYGGSVEIQ